VTKDSITALTGSQVDALNASFRELTATSNLTSAKTATDCSNFSKTNSLDVLCTIMSIVSIIATGEVTRVSSRYYESIYTIQQCGLYVSYLLSTELNGIVPGDMDGLFGSVSTGMHTAAISSALTELQYENQIKSYFTVTNIDDGAMVYNYELTNIIDEVNEEIMRRTEEFVGYGMSHGNVLEDIKANIGGELVDFGLWDFCTELDEHWWIPPELIQKVTTTVKTLYRFYSAVGLIFQPVKCEWSINLVVYCSRYFLDGNEPPVGVKCKYKFHSHAIDRPADYTEIAKGIQNATQSAIINGANPISNLVFTAITMTGMFYHTHTGRVNSTRNIGKKLLNAIQYAESILSTINLEPVDIAHLMVDPRVIDIDWIKLIMIDDPSGPVTRIAKMMALPKYTDLSRKMVDSLGVSYTENVDGFVQLMDSANTIHFPYVPDYSNLLSDIKAHTKRKIIEHTTNGLALEWLPYEAVIEDNTLAKKHRKGT